MIASRNTVVVVVVGTKSTTEATSTTSVATAITLNVFMVQKMEQVKFNLAC